MDIVSGMNSIIERKQKEEPTMIKLEFSPEAIEALEYERYHHPPPKVQRKMEAVYFMLAYLEAKTILPISTSLSPL